MGAAGQDELKGEIAEGVLPELLRRIYVERRTAMLRCVRGDEEQSLRFRGGHIVNAHTNIKEDRLGEMLVRRGLLSEDGLKRATEIVIREKRRLGEVLADLGLLDTNGLEDAIAIHVHEMLARLFSWTEGTYALADEPQDTTRTDVTLKLSTGELILEAARAVKDPDVVRYALGDVDRVLNLSGDPLLRFQKLTLSSNDGFVLSRIDGTTTVRELLQLIPLPVEETQKSLFGLVSTGVVEYGEKRKREPGAAPAAAPVAPRPTPPEPAAAAPPPAPRKEPEPAPRPAPPPPPPAASAPPPAAPPPPAPAEAPASAAPAAPLDAKGEERRREILDAWEGLATRNHFEVLGLARNVGEVEVKEAYFRLAKRFHPDVHHGASLGDLREKLEAVFIRLGEAYDTLRDRGRRGDYEARLGRARPQALADAPGGATPAPARPGEPAAAERDQDEEARMAEQSLHRAAKLLEHAKALEQEKPNEPEHQRLTFDAIQLLEPAIERLGSSKQKLRAQTLLARGYSKNPKWLKRAEELLLTVTRAQPENAEAWALLGHIYAERGIKSRALSMYKKALELKPDHEESIRFVAENGGAEPPPGEAEGGGLLGRFFKKT
jgi:curved DNA-binding protein CbpA